MAHIYSQKEGQFNDKNELIDLYIPRKCAITNKVISAKDRSSVQINVGVVDEQTGRYTGENLIFAFSGFVRKQGRADAELEILLNKQGLFPYKE
mmetsp:Transcript_105823/g.147549  ORF Transcript_105823/g.147549 Transcript_105823/m.147549 type:complete len:94 (-) Transcript_105823:414-695(-)